MHDKIDHQTDMGRLRFRAEELLRGQPRELDELSSADMRRLVHELQVHQIELELQNEELRRTQLELVAARDRYFDLYDLAPVGYFTVDRHGLILEVNLTGAALMGIDRRELIKRPFSLFVASDDQDVFFSHRQQALESGTVQSGELSMRTGDGTQFRARLDTIVITDRQNPEAVLYRTVVRNVTERVQAEEAVRQRNATLALLYRIGHELTAALGLEQAVGRLLPAVIETLDTDGASVWLRDEAEGDWLVYSGAAQGENVSVVNARVRLDASLITQVTESGKSVIVPNLQDDPRSPPTIDELTDIPIRSLLAVPLRVRGKVIGALRSINKRAGVFDQADLALVETLAASAAIAIDNAHLIEVLQQLTEDLQARNDELDTFAHTLAHGFKNSVSRIVFIGDILRQEIKELPQETIQDLFRRITETGRKMGEDVDGLLLLSGASGTHEVKIEPLVMGTIVTTALESLTALIEKYHAEILLPESWPEVLGYEQWVEAAWVNYISNAIKYGGRPPLVELGSTLQPTGLVRFWVRDNGAGLTVDEQSRLFIPFQRIRHSDVRGHGLGLSIVRRIVERLGGQAGVESAGIAGKGSVFYFTLPTGRS